MSIPVSNSGRNRHFQDRLSTKQSGNKNKTLHRNLCDSDHRRDTIDKKHITAVVLLDMSKAFDSIDDNLLLVKFEDVGASPLAIQWVCSYLTSRYQDVVIGTAVSERLQQVVYFPGGHRWPGPFPLSIYMNDLPYGSTTLFCPVLRGRHQSPSVVPASRPITEITEINQDLARIRNWCFDNLNPDKTKLLLCGSKQMAAKIDNFQLSLLG